MASTTTFERGQVVVVNVPFTGQGGSKPRPAIVVTVKEFHAKLRDVIICPVSSQPRYFAKPGPGDHPLVHWKSVGLKHPSTARISNLVSVDKKLIRRVLGKLHADDLARVSKGLVQALGL